MSDRSYFRTALASTPYVCFAIFVVIWIILIVVTIVARLLKNCSRQQNRELLMWIRIALRAVCSNAEASPAQTAELHPSTTSYK